MWCTMSQCVYEASRYLAVDYYAARFLHEVWEHLAGVVVGGLAWIGGVVD